MEGTWNPPPLPFHRRKIFGLKPLFCRFGHFASQIFVEVSRGVRATSPLTDPGFASVEIKFFCFVLAFRAASLFFGCVLRDVSVSERSSRSGEYAPPGGEAAPPNPRTNNQNQIPVQIGCATGRWPGICCSVPKGSAGRWPEILPCFPSYTRKFCLPFTPPPQKKKRNRTICASNLRALSREVQIKSDSTKTSDQLCL